MKNEITSSTQLAARLTDLLYQGTYVSSDSAQALFDILADALAARPDIVAAVSAEMASHEERHRQWYFDINTRLNKIEQDYNKRNRNSGDGQNHD